MINKITSLFIILILLSCYNNNEKDDETNNLETHVSSEQYKIAPSDPLEINSLKIVDHNLIINFSAGGCSGDSWELKLIDSDNILESDPPIRKLRLSFKNDELCKAYITKELIFNISNLQIEGDRILLDFKNYEENLLYEY